jgi:hypothetical protein
MIRLGLHIALHSGRAALTRLAITAAAVGIGVTLLLSVMAMYHGYQSTIARPCWTCTGFPAVGEPIADGATPTADPGPNAELWNFVKDFYRGTAIERADVAALGPQAPIVPGLDRVPAAGQYYASPALARLIATVPRDELGDRFAGSMVGVIGPAGLSGPDDLAIVVGHNPAELVAAPNTLRITAIHTAPRRLGDTVIYGFGFLLGAVALLVPMLMLIGNATRLAAARREERFAAMRLVGATPRQISVIASVESVVGALAGTLLGLAGYALVQPTVAAIRITGERFFPAYVTPTVAGFAAVLVGVPVAAGVAALVALRRVRISPLGVSRRVTPPRPGWLRLLPVLVGLVLFIGPLALGDPTNPPGPLAALGLALIMIGLMVAGSWLTMQAARVLGRTRPGPASLLAARRMSDDPRSTFRAISGVVLAMFVATMIAGVVPAALAAQRPSVATKLGDVLELPLAGASVLGGQKADGFVGQLRSFENVAVLPLYHDPSSDHAIGPDGPVPQSVVECADLSRFSAFGRCAAGASAAMMDDSVLRTDNVAFLNRSLPLVTQASQRYSGDISQLRLGFVLIQVEGASQLERVRTLLTVRYPGLTAGSGFAAQTIGEVAQARAALYTELATVTELIVVLTLLVAGCGIAIAMGGGVVDRKRPFTLLRVSGTPTGVLRRVVLIESVLPLAAAAVVAGLIGFVASLPVNRVLNQGIHASVVHLPDHTYYLGVGAGLLVAIAVIFAVLPLLGRVTVPSNARFE